MEASCDTGRNKTDGTNGLVNLVPAQTEQQIFAALGLDWKEPVDRNCEVVTVGEGTLLAHSAM